MGGHALLSASSSERWINCTPSARMTEHLPYSSNSYAEEGALAHKFAESYCRYKFKQMSKSDLTKELKTLKESIYYSNEMEDYAINFSDYIVEKYNGLRILGKTKTATVFFEQKLDYSAYVPEGYGTGDVILIGENILEIVDFKYGKGVQVSSENNTQMMLYALGAYEMYGLLYDISKVVMTIYQPRIDNISVFEMPIEELLFWADEVLKEKAHLAFDGAGDFVSGDHCRFCGIKATCRARAEENLKIQQYDYKHPNLLSDDEVADVLIIVDRLIAWASDIKAFALNEALEGKKWRGSKLVEGRSNRIYTDKTTIEKILKSNGYTDEEIFTKELLGITAMGRLLTKTKFNSLLSDYIIKPQGKPTLVLETDPRPEFNRAELDFKDVDVSNL